ncbi:hypothetical protein ABIC35_000223 [Sphingomonas trueperi]
MFGQIPAARRARRRRLVIVGTPSDPRTIGGTIRFRL